LNLSIALACQAELVRHGIEVKMSRAKDENDTLQEEIRECNAYGPDLAIDIHNNAGGGDGVEAYCHIGGGLSRTMAENVVAEIVKIGQNSRGVKTRTLDNGLDYYGFIRETKAPAVIVECAFIDNKTDIKIIDTAAEQRAMGVAVAKGVLKTLGIKHSSSVEKKLEVGSTVRLKNGAKYYDGKTPKSFVYKRNHKVKSISGDRVVITYLGITVGAVKASDLTII
jgi:hypothetical protein